jgi:hypothetical protein
MQPSRTVGEVGKGAVVEGRRNSVFQRLFRPYFFLCIELTYHSSCQHISKPLCSVAAIIIVTGPGLSLCLAGGRKLVASPPE